MTDSRKTNHWDLLASKLGAGPPPAEEETPEVESAEEEKQQESEAGAGPRGQQRPPREPACRPAKPPTDWSRVADEVGVEPSEEDASIGSEEAELFPPSDFEEVLEETADLRTEMVSAESPTSDAAAPEAETEAAEHRLDSAGPGIQPSDFAAGLGEPEVESTCKDLVPMDAVAKPLTLGEEPPTEEEEPKAARRRRKRRRKPSKVIDGEPAEAVSEEGDSDSGQPRPQGLTGESSPSQDADTAELADVSAGEEQESPGRPRRRRRRRTTGRKKEPDKTDGRSSSKTDDGRELAAAGDEPAEAKSDDAGGKREAQPKPKSERASKSTRSSHRGIPSWREAVDIVISANLEARSKKPDGGFPSRSRGGHSRSGRDRSSEKTG